MEHNQITPEWIDQQRAVCEAATPGPWKSNDVRLDGMPVVFSENRRICDAVIKDGQSAVDADLIATARTALPAALDALEAAYAEIARLTAQLDAVTRERDAAVKDLYYLAEDHGHCDICAHDDDGFTPIPPHCIYVQENCFKWRGVCAENAQEVEG